MATPIPPKWEVPQVFRDRIGAHAGRQRTMAADGHVLIILHDLPDPDDPDTRVAHLYWRSPEGKWRATGQAKGPGALREHVDRFQKKLDDLELRVERAASADDYFSVLHEVAPIRHASRNMHRALQEARESANDDKDIITERDRAGDLERAAELVYGYANDGLDFTVAKQSEAQARASRKVEQSSHRLNMLAALTLPITAVGSILGMNLGHGYETWHVPWAFWGVTAASFALGFLVKAALAR